MKMLADFFKSAWKEVAVRAKFCCDFLRRRRDPSANVSHHSAPEREICLFEESETLIDNEMKEQSNAITYLPEELIVNILARLPAEVIHRYVKFVCMRWAYIVSDPFFIEAHLRQSKTGLFIEPMGSPGNAYFLEIIGGQFKFTYYIHQFPGRMIASCDGIALFNDPNDITALYVANPVTMEAARLPHLNAPPNPLYYTNSIARGHSTGKYKVVHSYEGLNKEYHWLVLTVGTDNSWREISCEQTFSSEYMDLDNFPVSVGGVIYWTDYDFEVDGIIYFLAMDVDDETIHLVPIPPPTGSPEPCAYMKMGDYLSGFITAPLSLQYEIYVLKDWRRGEWAKVYQIDLDVPRDQSFYMPFGWLNDDEVLLLEGMTLQGAIYLAYDVKKKETHILNLSICGRCFHSHVHTNTLVSWMTP